MVTARVRGLGFFSLLFLSIPLHAYPKVVIHSVTYSLLAGPIHHGLVVDTNGIDDPNLTAYEIEVKPDSGGPFPPYRIYNTKILPHDGRILNIPYRNGIAALKGETKYCVRVRAIYGETMTPWAEQCSVTIPVVDGKATDEDKDGLSEKKEYALGTDPRDKFTAGDKISDGDKVKDGIDPTLAILPDLIVRSATMIDFGKGDAFGGKKTQHQILELENAGEANLRINSLKITDSVTKEDSSAFRIGSYPALISHIPPFNRAFIPISFIPKQRGIVYALLSIDSSNPVSAPPTTLRGFGAGIPDCNVTPDTLDFGTLKADDQDVAVKEITLANKPVPGDTQPWNSDNTPWGLTLSATNLGMAPGIRGLVLSRDEELQVPVFFPHLKPGNYDSDLEIRSFHCGVQKVHLKGEAK